MAGRFKNRTALVSGGARGIGLAIARQFVAEGARVATIDLPGVWAEPPVGAAGRCPSILAIQGDVALERDVERAVSQTEAEFGRIDVFVSNAGVAPTRPFLEMDAELFDQVMAVNVRGSFLMTLAAARSMVAGGGGAIVQIASTCAFTAGASRNLCAYNMSKAAVRQMVASLASELAEHAIRINAVAPGSIDTDMTRSHLRDEESMASTIRRIPLKSLGQPDDIAAACIFLCSEEARYITGQTLVVDGGWLVR
ncbi:3-oxoacyl-ACP reductase FabG [soil metagenome]|nr:SDR family oxidoreductase [Acidobacteriota bacterium]